MPGRWPSRAKCLACRSGPIRRCWRASSCCCCSALFLLSAVLPPHPLTAFGPPGPATPEVKPDWYLMWIFGFLKIVPSQASFSLFGATVGPTFLGGVLFPALLFGLLTLTPWVDRTNRRVVRRFEYLEPVRQ